MKSANGALTEVASHWRSASQPPVCAACAIGAGGAGSGAEQEHQHTRRQQRRHYGVCREPTGARRDHQRTAPETNIAIR
jgi:hypothetical protein